MNIDLFRIVDKQYQDSAFSGQGAKESGARWNSKGVPMVYTSSSRALCMMETIVYRPSRKALERMRMYRISVPEKSIWYPKESELPSDWAAGMGSLASKAFGDSWAASNTVLAMCVPSRTVTGENNVLLNPLHPKFGLALKSVVKVPVNFDDRL